MYIYKIMLIECTENQFVLDVQINQQFEIIFQSGTITYSLNFSLKLVNIK